MSQEFSQQEMEETLSIASKLARDTEDQQAQSLTSNKKEYTADDLIQAAQEVGIHSQYIQKAIEHNYLRKQLKQCKAVQLAGVLAGLSFMLISLLCLFGNLTPSQQISEKRGWIAIGSFCTSVLCNLLTIGPSSRVQELKQKIDVLETSQ